MIHTYDIRRLSRHAGLKSNARRPPIRAQHRQGEGASFAVEGIPRVSPEKQNLQLLKCDSSGRPAMHMFRAMKKHNSLKCL